MSLTTDVLNFWFGDADLSRNMEQREIWFRSTPEFDAAIKEKFLTAYEQAARNELDQLMETAEGSLALIILMDQFPRNLFRGSAQSFATDGKARGVSDHMLDRGFDQKFGDWPRIFVYLPFEHSEILADQEKSVPLTLAVGLESPAQAAADHRGVIARFGRFPHRNQIMGRANTPEEDEYMKNPPEWGKSAAEREKMENDK